MTPQSRRNIRCCFYNDDGIEWVHANGVGCRRGSDCPFAHPEDPEWDRARPSRPLSWMLVEEFPQRWERRRRSPSNISPHPRTKSSSQQHRREHSPTGELSRTPQVHSTTHASTRSHDPQSSSLSLERNSVAELTPGLLDSHAASLDPRTIKPTTPLSNGTIEQRPPPPSEELPAPAPVATSTSDSPTLATSQSIAQDAEMASAVTPRVISTEEKRAKWVKLINQFHDAMLHRKSIHDLDESLNQMKSLQHAMNQRAELTPPDATTSSTDLRAILAERLKNSEAKRSKHRIALAAVTKEMNSTNGYFPGGRRQGGLSGPNIPIQAQITALRDDVTSLHAALEAAVQKRDAMREVQAEQMEVDEAPLDNSRDSVKKMELLWNELEQFQEQLKTLQHTHEQEKAELQTHIEDRFEQLENQTETIQQNKARLDELEKKMDDIKTPLDTLTRLVEGLGKQREHAAGKLLEAVAANQDLRGRMDNVTTAVYECMDAFKAEHSRITALQATVIALNSEPLSNSSPELRDITVNATIERLQPTLQNIERSCRQLVAEYQQSLPEHTKVAQEFFKSVNALMSFAKLEAANLKTTGKTLTV